ncbi:MULTISPECIES: YegP family protein [unclassified Zymobacter]|uniref:YegP family protein n=1 Tax=unclassified Zymobacter TaxID=3048685 RepID=UPI0039C049AB
MAAKFEIYKSSEGQFRFRLKVTNNGEIILASEAYTQKVNCKKGIESVKKNAPEDTRYARKENKAGKWYFVLKAGNHEVIGTSQAYSSEAACKKGIESVKRHAPDAELVDTTTTQN